MKKANPNSRKSMDKKVRASKGEDTPKRAFKPKDTPSAKKTYPPKDESTPKRAYKPKDDAAPKRAYKPKDDAAPKRTFTSKDDAAPKRAYKPKDDATPKRAYKPKDDAAPKRTFTPKDDAAPRRTFTPKDDAAPKRTFTPKDDAAPKRTFTPKDDAAPKRTFTPKDDAAPKRNFAPKDDAASKRSVKKELTSPKFAPREEKEPREKRVFTAKKPVAASRTTSSKGDGFKHKDKDLSLFQGKRSVFKPKIERIAPVGDGDEMRLNKYIASCGVASRRGAVDLVKDGHVTVNGEVVKEIGYKVMPNDKIAYKGKDISPVIQKIYILVNKPKDTITTVSDEKGRKTVLDLVGKTIKERIYPVGRLDRDTTGLLLMTNDGDLSQKMTHPSFKVKKIYHTVLNKPLTREDLKMIQQGLKLEDGVAEVDVANYVQGAGKEEVLLEIHIGKNRIVRRIFEHLGYEVVKLDRIYYGGLTKKDLPRGGYRSLTQEELIMLKHFSGQ
jgi:23S rRNA pseudouridine2605 synthase